MKPAIRLGLAILIWVCLAGCTVNFRPVIPGLVPGPTPSGSSGVTPAPSGLPSPGEKPTLEPTPAGPLHLLIWLPSELDPGSGSPSAELLKARLAAFEEQYPGIRLDVRVKSAAGPSGLLDSLAAASAAAPRALPDLIALPRADLEAAALKGLLIPFEGLTKVQDDPDWFTYSRQLATIGGRTFGLPFAGDALLLVYRPSHLNAIPSSWDTLLRQSAPLAFPTADPQALFSLTQYLAAGGAIEDSQGRPTIAAEQLTQILKNYETGVHQGVFPSWLSQYETDGQSWQAYRDQRAQMAVTWVTRYLAEMPPDSSAIPLPSDKPGGLTLATGWVWALSNPRSAHLSQTAGLAEYLVASNFLAQWTEAAGIMPTRPTALAAWKGQEQQALLGPIALSAQAQPAIDLLASIGPVLKEAVVQVIKNQLDPAQAATAAAERFKNP